MVAECHQGDGSTLIEFTISIETAIGITIMTRSRVGGAQIPDRYIYIFILFIHIFFHLNNVAVNVAVPFIDIGTR